MQWEEIHEFGSMDEYASFEKWLCEELWAHRGEHLSSNRDYSPVTSVWVGVTCVFEDADGGLWELTKPDFPSRGGFRRLESMPKSLGSGKRVFGLIGFWKGK